MHALDTLATVFRNGHIAAGVTALLAMPVPLLARKGARAHRAVGKIYVAAMFAAAVTAVLIAPIRMHQRDVAHWRGPIFLSYIALLSFTSCFYGVRVLRQKKRTAPHTELIDRAVPTALVVASIAVALYGLITRFPLAVLFAPVGLLVAVPQLRTMRSVPTAPRWWLTEHLGAMLISCIATVTAFLVVNVGRITHHGASPLIWIAPTILGTALLTRWKRLYQSPTAPP